MTTAAVLFIVPGKSSDHINGNAISNQSQARDDLDKPSPNPIPNVDYGPLGFEINHEFVEENKKLNTR